MKIRIATADSRYTKEWHNKTIEWSELVKKCRETHRTKETVAEYARMKKSQQADRKDVGGFVGGPLKDGLRKNGNVLGRSVVTLDIDFGNGNEWNDWTLSNSYASFMYSTHKHTAAAPRLRLVVLLSREVKPEEYEPIARWVAAEVGIDKFDHTTYELPRLFYWPSTSQDGEFVFEEQTGGPLDADWVLLQYGTNGEWRDSSNWKYGKGETRTLNREMKHAGDPTEKNGQIGAFCRAYGICEAIEVFLSDVYEKTATEGRYTYREGSVAGGLVTYEDKFAYSHHDTDPASRQLCNAFDLVRIHKFGHLDEDCIFTDITKLPSYKAMVDFVSHDKGVNALLIREKQEKVADDFAGIGPEEEEEPEEDKGKAKKTKLEPMGADELACQLENGKNGIASSVANILTILEYDKRLAGHFWHCDFSSYDFADAGLPWRRSGLAWSDKDDANLRVYLDLNYGIQGKEKISDSLDRVFSNHRRHPIREYLDSLTWDGRERLDTLITDYIGAEDNELNRAMTRKIFTAAVRRVFEPGCKFDYCLILSGGEGIGKSTFLKIMGGDWFSDSIVTTEGKEGMESLRQAWVIELAELASIKRSDVEQVKNFLSKQEDIYRAAYGKRTNHYPRQCVFFGTTNEVSFLKGDTGNRRFWVIPVDASLRKIEGDLFERLKADRDQLWAEAMVRYRAGERLYLDAEQEAEARGRQNSYNIDADDPVPGLLDEYLEQLLPPDWYSWDIARRRAFFQNPDPLAAESMRRTKFYAGEFVYERLGLNLKDKEYGYEMKKVNKLMRKKEGWKYDAVRINGYGRQKGWYKKSDAESDTESDAESDTQSGDYQNATDYVTLSPNSNIET